MNYRTKIIALSTAVALLTIHAIAFTDVRGTIAQNQNRPPTPSEIVNTEDNPVPVDLQGTGEVSGSVSATQAGEWDVNSSQDGDWNVQAEQNGDWTVGLDPSANTVQVEGVTDANKEIFHGFLDLTWGDSMTASNNFTVPEGKRLVIEQLSAHAITSNNMDYVLIEVPPSTTFGPFWDVDSVTTYRLPMTRGDHQHYRGSEQVTIYADGGEEVALHAIRDSTSTSGQNQTFVTIIGYLVELP